MSLIIPPFILIEETINKFGYDPSSLKGIDGRSKMIVRTCFDCNNIYDQQLKNAIHSYKENKKCKYCANKERAQANAENQSLALKAKYASGEFIHPMLGKNHSQETKNKIKNKTEGISLEQKVGKERANELKMEASKRFSGDKNPFYGKQHSKEIMDIILPILAKNVKRGKESNFYGKKYWPNRKLLNYNGILYRSKWEMNTAIYFDSNNIKFEFEPKYFDLSNNTSYTPDFYLSEQNKWIEVKGYWYDDAREKLERFKKEYPDIIIEVWEKEKLTSLGIIK